MSGDQAVRSVSTPFSNRILIARSGGSQTYGDARRPRGQVKTFDLVLSDGAQSDTAAAAFENQTQNGGQDQPASEPSQLGSKVYQGSLGIFRQFSEAHPELHGSELLDAFFTELRNILARGPASPIDGLNGDEMAQAAQSVDSLISEIRPLLRRQVSVPAAGEEPRVNIFA